jgi:hypothetical protein
MSLARVDFNPQDFEDIIQQKGYRVLWEKNLICPCIDPVTLHPVPNCVNCDGRGKYYYDPKEIRGLITRQTKELLIGEALGVLESGTAYITVSHDNYINKFDRMTNLDSTVKYQETVIHDDKTGEADWLSYPVATTVEVAITQPTRTSPLVTLVQNIDFTIEADGKIDWISAKKPRDKQGVSFSYYMHPVWEVISIPNYVRDTWVLQGNPTDTVSKLPIRAEIRLEFLGPSTTKT